IVEEKEVQAKLGETTSKAREQKMAAGEVHKKALAAIYEKKLFQFLLKNFRVPAPEQRASKIYCMSREREKFWWRCRGRCP
ncbi:60_t:CDS:1, partial [Gigaspora margarita]